MTRPCGQQLPQMSTTARGSHKTYKELKCIASLNYFLLFQVLIAAAVCTKAGKSK